MAERAGVAVSTLHFYEAEGLIESWRTPANHRRYDRRELRRVAIIRVAQGLGIPLAEIREVLGDVPRGRAVSAADWAGAAENWAEALDDRIEQLLRLRDSLGACIGCGCLSLEHCPLYNPADTLGSQGPGAQKWAQRPAKPTAS
ncbi:redox-sensitive transcriptional activator SoxR [Alphaproteobacteria bacterium KMM 3653]|uniref:Redox-sensitive transcriptional activator SoxR n=2 Tax=Harenicola maris TaxID=2841044 RepID=A0AAP2CNL0_9RHOB|nr:redox-sensitive transcriptional activator SoxR [Harenicola maris]